MNELTIKTIQINPFRTLLSSLKDILLEANITFQPDGMRIVNLDKSKAILVHLFLKAESFEQFTCNKPRILIGVNMHHFYKLIHSMDKHDTLIMAIEPEDYTDGIVTHLTIRFENGLQCKTQKLRLIEPDMELLEVPEVEFRSVVTMPSIDFQKIIRDMSSISDKVEITSIGNELIFSGKGPFASVEVKRVGADCSTSEFIRGEFLVKSLSSFIKCTPLSTSMQLYLENDMPLVVVYHVATLGTVKLCLSQLGV